MVTFLLLLSVIREILPKDEYFWTSKEFHRPSAAVKRLKVLPLKRCGITYNEL
jgi:hypothetical protein